jgi:hypothetical protein
MTTKFYTSSPFTIGLPCVMKLLTVVTQAAHTYVQTEYSKKLNFPFDFPVN